MFGTFGENNELAAMKSAGLPLFRIMRPIIILMVFISFGAFLFYNYVIPVANLKSEALVLNISKQKPALNIRQGVFNKDIEGYSIKVGTKSGENDNELKNVLIYDHSASDGNTKLTVADHGKLNITEDERYMEILLYNGHTYEEVKANTRKERNRRPFIKASFDEAVIRFDLRQFQTGNLHETGNKNFYMMNVNQLMEAADSLKKNTENRKTAFNETFLSKYYFDDLAMDSAKPEVIPDNVLAYLNNSMRQRAVENALRMARSNVEYLNQIIQEYEWRRKLEARHYLEWHKKFSLSVACMVLFFIGAPLGAIIRKGGMGMPVVISFVIFIIFHVINTTFEKTGRELVLEPWSAIWMGTFILAPFGIILTYNAANDSSILSSEFYSNIIRFFSKNPFKRNKKEETK